MIVVESAGSMWYLDETAHTYRRTPKSEAPRERGPWVEPEPGDPLYDLEEHQFLRWTIVPEWPDDARERLDAIRDVADPAEYDFISRCFARAVRYDSDQFPLLCVLVSDDGQMVSAPRARQVYP